MKKINFSGGEPFFFYRNLNKTNQSAGVKLTKGSYLEYLNNLIVVLACKFKEK